MALGGRAGAPASGQFPGITRIRHAGHGTPTASGRVAARFLPGIGSRGNDPDRGIPPGPDTRRPGRLPIRGSRHHEATLVDSPAVTDYGRGRPRLLRASLLVTGLMVVLAAFTVLGPSGSSDGAVPALAQTAPTSTPRPLVFGRSTATPTPRVVAIPGPTSRSTSTPAPAAPAGNTPSAATPTVTVPTPTPPSDLPSNLRPTATATPSPIPTATVTPIPTATPTPVPTPTPSPTPIPLPTPALPTRVAFTAADWSGGYYRGDALAYGRPWVALYGAQSAYPRAVLSFELEASPTGPSRLTLTGLDDEWAGSTPIELAVNGQLVFAGPSPFASWDGVGDGSNAAWTAVAFELPADLLTAGRNEVVIANLAPAANFNAPPYVLLADASLEVSGAGVGE